MAEFCFDCTKETFGEVPLKNHDFYGLCKEGEIVHVLCEGCGYIWVDHTGKINPEEGVGSSPDLPSIPWY